MMTHQEALEVVAANRGDRIVVTTMGSVGLWPAISDSPRDFHYLPSSMGQGVPLAIVLIDNGLYEVTGGQSVPGAGRTDFAMLARGSGIDRVQTFQTREEWAAGAAEILANPEPTFSWLQVEGVKGQATPSAPRPMAEQIARLRAAIAL